MALNKPYKLSKIPKKEMKKIDKTPELYDIMPHIFNLGVTEYNYSLKAKSKKKEKISKN